MATIKAYFVHATTGCSCCHYENRYIGPYLTAEARDEEIESLGKTKQFASQYAPNGVFYKTDIDMVRLEIDGEEYLADLGSNFICSATPGEFTEDKFTG